MARRSFKKPGRPCVDVNETCRFLSLPAELRQRIYSYIFYGSTVVRSYIDPRRRKPLVGLCDYPANEEAPFEYYQRWLASNVAYKNVLLTCKAIYHDALATYLGNSTLSISVCQLAHAPRRTQHLRHVRHIEINEQVDRHLSKMNMAAAVRMLHEFSSLESVGLAHFEFTNYRKHEEYFGPNNDGLKEAILADSKWGFFVNKTTKALPKVELMFETRGCATLGDLVNRIGDRNKPGPRTAKWLATSTLKLGSVRGDIEAIAAAGNIETGPDTTPSEEGTDSGSNELTDDGFNDDPDDDDDDEDDDDEDDETFDDIVSYP